MNIHIFRLVYQYQRIFVAACAPTVLRQSCTCLSLDVLSVRRMRAQQGFQGRKVGEAKWSSFPVFLTEMYSWRWCQWQKGNVTSSCFVVMRAPWPVPWTTSSVTGSRCISEVIVYFVAGATTPFSSTPSVPNDKSFQNFWRVKVFQVWSNLYDKIITFMIPIKYH